MPNVSELRKQIQNHPGLNRYVFRDWKLIQPEDIGIHDVLYIMNEDEEGLNLIPCAMTKSHMRDEDYTDHLIANMDWVFMYKIQKRMPDGKWVDVENEEGLQPQKLLENGALSPGDIIRFLDINDEVSPVTFTAEEALIDTYGLFYIGISFDDYSEMYADKLYDAVEDDDEDDDDDEDEDFEEKPYTFQPSIVPATPLLEYVKANMGTIKKIGLAVDEIEAMDDPNR